MDVIGISDPKRNVQSGKRGLMCRELADDREPAEKGREASRDRGGKAVRELSETPVEHWGNFGEAGSHSQEATPAFGRSSDDLCGQFR